MSGDVLTFEGVVLKYAHNTAHVEVDLGGGSMRTILATRNGRMNRNKIHVIAGDRVTVELSPYDLSRGRITERAR